MELQHRPPSPIDQSLIKALRLVDDDTGVVKMVHEAPIAPDTARIFGCGALCSDFSDIGFPSENSVSGSTALTRDQAIVGAIGEAVERYSAAYVPYEDIVFSSYAAIEANAIDPRSLVLYSAQQCSQPGFGYEMLGEHDSIGWIPGYSLTRGRTILVPACGVYQPYQRRPGERPVIQQITTGLACGNTREEAILSALCEVVERDAAMLMWLQSRRLPIVDVSIRLPDAVAETFQRFGPLARYVTLLDATTDIAIPAYVAVWDGPIAGANGAIFASCAKPTASRAAVGALTELVQCLMWAASLIDKGTSLPDPVTGSFDQIADHVMWPMRPESRPAFSFALSSKRRTSFPPDAETSVSDVLAEVIHCVERIAAVGLEAIVVDVTSPDIRESGLHVVRAIIPGAQPLFFGKGLQRLSARAMLGQYPDRAMGGINLHPHPFP